MCQLALELPKQQDLFADLLATGELVEDFNFDQEPNLDDYDRFVVLFSGGKDSLACVLYLLDQGVSKDRIELHHHDVDGRESDEHFFDWPITRSYCESFAKALGIKIYFSWRRGGLEREMLRNEQRTAPVCWESEDGTIKEAGGVSGKLGTRRMFPQVTASLSQRWCSAYLKVDVGARLLVAEERFRNGKTCVVSGERAEESAARARYRVFEPDRCDNRNGARVQRWIDHLRPVHGWSEQQVWDIIAKYRVNPHPCYWLGWGRCSCLTCIFGSADQWSSARAVAPLVFQKIANYEEEFGKTIHRKLTVIQQADRGNAYPMEPSIKALAMSDAYPVEMIFVSGEWKLPPGAFGESTGPM